MLVELGNTIAPVKMWTNGVPVEHAALEQLRNIGNLPIVEPHVAVMPDAHFGIGATVGSVIPTRQAIIPAAVGVDIGCGMCAVRTITDGARRAAFDGTMSGLVRVAGLGAKAGDTVSCDFGNGYRKLRLYKTTSGLWASPTNTTGFKNPTTEAR